MDYAYDENDSIIPLTVIEHFAKTLAKSSNKYGANQSKCSEFEIILPNLMKFLAKFANAIHSQTRSQKLQ